MLENLKRESQLNWMDNYFRYFGYGYYDNPIVETKVIGKQRFVIKSNGKISEESDIASTK